MVIAFDLSSRLGLCPQEVPARVEAHLKSCGLKTRITDIKPVLQTTEEDLMNFMRGDKKANHGKIGFILAKDIGQAFQTFDVNDEDVVSLLRELLEK